MEKFSNFLMNQKKSYARVVIIVTQNLETLHFPLHSTLAYLEFKEFIMKSVVTCHNFSQLIQLSQITPFDGSFLISYLFPKFFPIVISVLFNPDRNLHPLTP
jgi:hypothetical protein